MNFYSWMKTKIGAFMSVSFCILLQSLYIIFWFSSILRTTLGFFYVIVNINLSKGSAQTKCDTLAFIVGYTRRKTGVSKDYFRIQKE